MRTIAMNWFIITNYYRRENLGRCIVRYRLCKTCCLRHVHPVTIVGCKDYCKPVHPSQIRIVHPSQIRIAAQTTICIKLSQNVHVSSASHASHSPPDQLLIMHLQAISCSLCWVVFQQDMLCCVLYTSVEPTQPAFAGQPCSICRTCSCN